MRTKIRVVDFFCGCGGTSAGLRRAGMKVLLGIDRDPDAANTFRLNFPEAAMIEDDIRKVRAADLDAYVVPKNRSYPLLFSMCAPCQPFSKQNRHKASIDDRFGILDEMHRFIRRFMPDFIFLENVPGLQRIQQKDDQPFVEFQKVLATLRYQIDSDVVRSQDFGVPQCRERLVLVASRRASIRLPKPSHGPGTANLRYSTVGDWIKDLPPLAAGETDTGTPNHQCMRLSSINLDRIQHTKEGGNRYQWPTRLRLDCHDGHTGHSDVYGRLCWTRPASALTTRCISLSNGRFGHPDQDRAISVREAASLQTFPRDFVFCGAMTAAAAQVGNAVPVVLAERFGKVFIDCISNIGH